MRIAVVHSRYGSGAPSGENLVVAAQAEALRRAGHEVHEVTAATDELAGQPLYALRSAATVATGRGRSPGPRLRELAPDVVHVHNLFPNFGRSWVRSWAGPLVTTLHNYRPLCANALLYRDGAVCTRCPDGDRWAGLRHGCYRDSRAATLPLALAGRAGPPGDPLLARADKAIVLSELSRTTYERAGIPAARLQLIPNFVRAAASSPAPPGRRWVYVGRLSAEKGVLELLRRWPSDQPLDVIGGGPLAEACRAEAPGSVRFLGVLSPEDVAQLLPRYAGLVFPGRCYEGMPTVYGEALAAGVPVLAFEGSSVPLAVRAEGTGLVVREGEPLGPVLAEATARFPGLRGRCREVYARAYAESVWLARIERLYTDLCARPLTDQSTRPVPATRRAARREARA
ncbi:glycosyltransferase family 4 protein [Streptomyces sp. NBC_01304]|uniref:glycosyltransferase family 4 protein n=1 Tax=Streptomyces sp. NBC_01304 TaxID=2903818 RepID=UPI002E0DFB2E|nr:glycosyltransferase family 4 protein [Streptomyces sp. NBC_01304]